MEANELMIGDWVLFQDKPIKVFNVHSNSINETYIGFSNEVERDIDESDVEPIPLTSEIFEKNGFKLDEQDTPLFTLRVYSLDDDIAFIQRPKGGWKLMHGQSTSSQQELFFGEGKFVCMPIQYVHELQHALRLAGIKKEIVL